MTRQEWDRKQGDCGSINPPWLVMTWRERLGTVIRGAGGVVLFTFPVVFIWLMSLFGVAAVIYLPVAFGFVLWAVDAADLLKFQPSAGWRPHALALACGVFGGPLVFACFVGVMWVVGSIGDNIARESEYKARCQKNALTPYEYHQCR